ncbi:hypothetical protein EON63_12845 [archaeon]|nr:MAG: hypothetical protein EON63_12845 [archaeon]
MLSKRVQEADANMKNFIEKAASLESQRVSLQNQASELKSFLNRFHLSNEEISLLNVSSLDHPTHSKQFFQILQKLKIAYLDCQQLSVHAGYAVGFELLDSLGRHQDTAYEQLFQWVQAKCTYLSDLSLSAQHIMEDHELNNRLQLAISYLREVDVYYAQVQDLLVSARRSQLLQKFILVLTQACACMGIVRVWMYGFVFACVCISYFYVYVWVYVFVFV